MESRNKIIESIKKITGVSDIHLETPENLGHGDYATNVAMIIAKDKKKNPRTVGQEIIDKLKKDKDLEMLVARMEMAGPGFINFWLLGSHLAGNMVRILKDGDRYGSSDTLAGKNILIEHTSPNTTKTLHIGHVRNNVLGMAIHNILEFSGAEVSLDAINNDRGIHVMKAVWAYNKYGKGNTPKSKKMKSDVFVDKYYVMGAKAAKDEKNKKQMQDLLKKWEAGDKEVRSTWKKLRDWTYKGFQLTYKRLGSHHDMQWFESDFWEKGKGEVEKGLKKGVFNRLKDGAVLTNLSKYNLSDTIVLRADGTTMYHTQDLYLTRLKRKKFPSDIYMWDISKDQILYLKQLFAMLEQLGIGKLDDYFHLVYGYINLKGKGKMSSRSGNVVSADWLIDTMVEKASKFNKKVAEEVGLSAIKYGLLKLSRTRDMEFDMDKSLSLEGNSGPYLQYTYARIRNVLRKSKGEKKPKSVKQYGVKQRVVIRAQAPVKRSVAPEPTYNEEESALLRTLIHFPEVVEHAAENYAPNLMCNYLFDLASKFNTFYNHHRILNIKSGKNNPFRLLLTGATGQVLNNGLKLLGIQAPEKM